MKIQLLFKIDYNFVAGPKMTLSHLWSAVDWKTTRGTTGRWSWSRGRAILRAATRRSASLTGSRRGRRVNSCTSRAH